MIRDCLPGIRQNPSIVLGYSESKIMPNPTASSVRDLRYGIRTDLLWVMVVLAGFLFFTSLVPLAPNDYWWHLRIGQVISSEHAIPETNIYSWSIPQDQPFFYGAWLGEWLLYVIYQLGGLPLSIFTRNLLVGITFFLVAKEARRRTGSWRIASLVLAMACLMCTNNMLLRPQMWALIPFVILYILLSRYQDGQLRGYWLGVCPILMAFWANVHGSFVLGLGLMGIYCLGEALNYLFKQRDAAAMARLIWLSYHQRIIRSVCPDQSQNLSHIYLRNQTPDRSAEPKSDRRVAIPFARWPGEHNFLFQHHPHDCSTRIYKTQNKSDPAIIAGSLFVVSLERPTLCALVRYPGNATACPTNLPAPIPPSQA